MTRFRIYLTSEPVSSYEFEDRRSLEGICSDIVRDGYCIFQDVSSRLGGAPAQGMTRQTVFLANIARIVEK